MWVEAADRAGIDVAEGEVKRNFRGRRGSPSISSETWPAAGKSYKLPILFLHVVAPCPVFVGAPVGVVEELVEQDKRSFAESRRSEVDDVRGRAVGIGVDVQHRNRSWVTLEEGTECVLHPSDDELDVGAHLGLLTLLVEGSLAVARAAPVLFEAAKGIKSVDGARILQTREVLREAVQGLALEHAEFEQKALLQGSPNRVVVKLFTVPAEHCTRRVGFQEVRGLLRSPPA